jgi:hypothetical protein
VAHHTATHHAMHLVTSSTRSHHAFHHHRQPEPSYASCFGPSSRPSMQRRCTHPAAPHGPGSRTGRPHPRLAHPTPCGAMAEHDNCRQLHRPLRPTPAPDEHVPGQPHHTAEWPARSHTLAASALAVPRAGPGPPRSAQRSHTEPRTPDADRSLLAQHALRRYPPPQRSQDRNPSSPLLPIPPKQTHTPGQHTAGSQRTQLRNSAPLLPAARRHGNWNKRFGPPATRP